MRSLLIAVIFPASGPLFAQTEPDMRGDKHFSDGVIQTGSGWHSISGRISRNVVDLTVPGDVGKYPLTVTRTMRNWVTNAYGNPNYPSWNQEAGCSARWAFNIDGYTVRIVDTGYTGDQGVFLQYPDGSIDKYGPNTGAGIYTFGTGDRVYVDSNKKVTLLKLVDGRKVYFRDFNDPTQRYWPTASVVDPYGLTFTYTVGVNASGQVESKISDASGRWVRLTYASDANSLWPIRADSSAGDSVDYVWDMTVPAGLHVTVDASKLMEAHYADGTVARYEYTSNVHGVFPFRCYDTRATTHMRAVQYRFDMNRAFWGDVFNRQFLALYPLLDERVPNASAALSARSEYATGYAWGLGVKETRGDGAVRSVVPDSAYNNADGRIYSETDFTAHQTSYVHGLSSTITDPLSRVTQFDYVQSTGSYSYNGNTPVIENPVKITFADGKFRQFTYTDLQNPYYVSQATDELGRVTVYDRTPAGLISQITYADGSTEAWTYNSLNEPLSHRLKNGSTEYFDYDSAGRLLKHRLAITPNAISYTYYPAGHKWMDRVKTITDPRGNVTTYEYDLLFVNGTQGTTACAGRGLVTKVINPDTTYKTFGYDIYGNKVWEENELRQRTSYTYDDYNRLLTTTNPLGQVSTIAYGDTAAQALAHTANAPRRTTSPAGRITVWTYDADKRPTLMAKASGTTDAQYIKYEYDAVGNLTKLREQTGGTAGSGSEVYRDTTYAYDNRDRRITEYAPLNRTTDFGYDDAGNNIWIHYADGSAVSKDYDGMNRVSRVTDEMGHVTSYSYFPSGQVQNITDPRNKIYSYTYDAMDRMLQFRLPNGAGTGYDYEQNTYDAAGNIVQFRNRSGSLKTLTYDNRNRETATSWNNTVTPGTSTSYDAASRVTQKSSSVSTLSYTFDSAGRVLTETQAIAGLSAKTLTYTYDADGARLSLNVTGGYGVKYAYNSRQLLTQVNWLNNLNAVTFGYRPDGLRKTRQLDNATSTNYDYDGAGRPTYLLNYGTANGAWIELQEYGYDLRDRRVWTRRNQSLGDTYAYQLDGELTDFRFDANNPNGTPSTWTSRNTFTYDAVGNRTSVVNNGTTVTYTPNSANRYTSITGVNIQHSDGRGNTTQLRGWTYGYDSDNRMVTATATGNSASFAYDPAGRLAKRTINGVIEFLIYDGAQIVNRFSSADSLTGWTIWGPNPNEPLIDSTPAAGKHYYHSDVQGNTIAVTDSNLATLELYRYDAYGNVSFWAWSGAQRAQSTAGTPFLFTGQEYMPVLALHNYRNRFYSADIGRFLQADPKRLAAGDLNLYRYCRNDPFDRTDPDGTVAVAIPWAAGEVTAAVVAGGLAVSSWVYLQHSNEITAATLSLIQDAKERWLVNHQEAAKEPVPIYISPGKHPEASEHAGDAVDKGVLPSGVIDRPGAKERRKENLADVPVVKGKDRDEFPPAVVRPDGGTSIRPISPGDNRGAGGSVGQQIKDLPDGTKVIFKPIDPPAAAKVENPNG